jgi:hypothetical protein
MLAAPHRRSDRRLGSHNRRSAKLAAGCLYWPWSTDTKYPATVRRQSAAYRVPHKGLRVFITCPCVIERTQLDSRQIALREGGLRQAQVAVGLPGNDRRARSREGARPRITYRARATVAQPRAALRGKADRGRPPRRATERPGSGGEGIKIYLHRSYWALAEALMASEHSQTSAATRALCAAPRRSLPGPRGRRVRSRKGG